MEKPKTFAGRVARKYGRSETNDYEQPEKFFAEMKTFYRLLDDVPYKAVEDLTKYDLNREVIFQVIERLFSICSAAGLNMEDEIVKWKMDPFDGLEEELAAVKKLKMDN